MNNKKTVTTYHSHFIYKNEDSTYKAFKYSVLNPDYEDRTLTGIREQIKQIERIPNINEVIKDNLSLNLKRKKALAKLLQILKHEQANELLEAFMTYNAFSTSLCTNKVLILKDIQSALHQFNNKCMRQSIIECAIDVLDDKIKYNLYSRTYTDKMIVIRSMKHLAKCFIKFLSIDEKSKEFKHIFE